METGIVGLRAPALEHVRWIDENGGDCEPLTLADLGHDFRILYFFQAGCESCHRHGFPTVARLVRELKGKGIGLAAIQTVFEGSDINTFDQLRENQKRYALKIPFGHTDTSAASMQQLPEIMAAYRSAGTPWFVVIDPDGEVVYDGFLVVADGLIQALRPLSS